MKNIFILISLCLTCCSCSTMFSGDKQSILIKTTKNVENQNIACTLNNSKGQWQTTTNVAYIQRGGGDLFINCNTIDHKYKGSAIVSSDFNAVSLLDIPLYVLLIWPGVVATIIDSSSGAIARYDKTVDVPFNMIATESH